MPEARMTLAPAARTRLAAQHSSGAPSSACRPMISSSSAPARPARSSPSGCRRAAAIRCWCWRPAARTGASTSRCRSATARPSSTPPSTGTTAPSPTPALPAMPTTGRAARSSAGRARSTPWSGSGASARISTPGRAAGNPGWGFDDLLPAFKAIEDNEAGADALARRRRAGPRHRLPRRTSIR